MKKPLRVALAAVAIAAASPLFAACDDNDTVGEKIDEAGEEIGDEIDDHTDED
jgi:predicted small secreted protein